MAGYAGLPVVPVQRSIYIYIYVVYITFDAGQMRWQT